MYCFPYFVLVHIDAVLRNLFLFFVSCSPDFSSRLPSHLHSFFFLPPRLLPPSLAHSTSHSSRRAHFDNRTLLFLFSFLFLDISSSHRLFVPYCASPLLVPSITPVVPIYCDGCYTPASKRAFAPLLPSLSTLADILPPPPIVTTPLPPSHPLLATSSAMSYSWIGAPAVFNGTDSGTGGDSGMYLKLTMPFSLIPCPPRN